MTEQIFSINQIQSARNDLGDLVKTTPVTTVSGTLLKKAFGDIDAHFKLELFQHAGSFKPRGALCVMRRLSSEQLSRGVVAVSAGNHAIATGYAAKVVATHAKVVMPRTASPIRIARCQSFGAEVILVDNVHQAFEEAQRLEQEESRTFVHPFEGPYTALGTATLGLELVEQVPDLDAVIVPIGGGGLCAGVAMAVKTASPKTKVYGVEPFGADTMTRSFAKGAPQKIEAVTTIADSLGAPHAASYSFGLCKRFVDDIVCVDDDALCIALARLFHDLKLAVEPAGAAATAALSGPLRAQLQGKRVGLIVCGANIDSALFSQYLGRGEGFLELR